ncbi:aminotransferase [Geopyxis carbonaria]|nr:aminotransferase [Geopyxis carbonaria]
MAPPTSLVDLAANETLLTANTTISSNGQPAKPLPTPTEPQLAELDASLLQTTLTTNPRPYAQPREWGRADVTTDHWVTASWTEETGWAAPQLRPYTRMDLWPTASCLHYATECFEGLKAYRGHDGKLRLFRPARNTARMLVSSKRIACPSFPPSQLESLIMTLLATDGPKWLPTPGTFMYIRPTMIGTGHALGVRKPAEAMLFIIMTLFPVLDGPMRLLASSSSTIRAWPGGFGYAKVGANYGPSLLAQASAKAAGFDQVLWLFGEDASVTEAGASNFFVLLRDATTSRLQLITAPLDDKIILDGVTRRSILELARERLGSEMDVVERRYTMGELATAHAEGRFVEAFAAGTAFFIAPVTAISWRGEEMALEDSEQSYTHRVKRWLREIMYGDIEHEWGVVVPEMGFEEGPKLEETEVARVEAEIKKLMGKREWARAWERVKAEELGETQIC